MQPHLHLSCPIPAPPFPLPVKAARAQKAKVPKEQQRADFEARMRKHAEGILAKQDAKAQRRLPPGDSQTAEVEAEEFDAEGFPEMTRAEAVIILADLSEAAKGASALSRSPGDVRQPQTSAMQKLFATQRALPFDGAARTSQSDEQGCAHSQSLAKRLKVDVEQKGSAAAPGAEAAQPFQPLTAQQFQPLTAPPVGASPGTKASLERTALLTESLLWRSLKVGAALMMREGAALTCEAPPPESAIALHLQAAADVCDAACDELSAACRCWVGTAQDSAAARELVARAEEALHHLADWAAIAGSVSQHS
jgi:hypothetical protein